MSRAMPTSWTPSVNSDVRSLAGSLEAELQEYSGLLKESKPFKGLSPPECEETPLPWSKSADRLCQKQTCTEEIQRYVDKNKRNKTETLAKHMMTFNRDLLQHLSVDACPVPSSPSSPAPGHPDFSVLMKLMQCITCWRKQVSSVAQQKTGSVL